MLSARAREAMLGFLSRPGFLRFYAAQQGQTDTDAAISELVGTLEKIGIAREAGLGAIAA